jgi:RimJ/RimL family protein N-acetyltransferase
MWAAELRGEHELIGMIGLAVPAWLPAVLPAVEVGWRLHPDWWGRGLATEGGRASLEYGFDVVRLDRIISIFKPENVASGRVMAKLGMRDCLVTEDPVMGGTLQVREITRHQWRAPAPHPAPHPGRRPVLPSP